ncbi:hypothetical protein [Bradyrhizobium canariense]|uniref:hypothetical protein n=1 Tax=Bradyrhizobium canariense TaxID=255045 RepID=UPI00142F710E|nr:hypothetical protein [Bradyrhizobium canariense]
MTFTSWQFGLFVAIVFGAYYLPPLRTFQIQLLVLASLFFYGYGQPELLPLLAVAVIGTYLLLILALRNRRLWLPVGIAFNLLLLAFFKYKFLFVAPASTELTGVAGFDFLLRLPLPIGISFFVFHNISLLVDLTRRKAAAPDLKSIFLYIIFFPQLVSGPITRAEMFMPQIQPKYFCGYSVHRCRKVDSDGLFFKLYVANNLNEMTSYMDFPLYETLQTQDRWLLVFLYGYQIYADFFGYSAIGDRPWIAVRLSAAGQFQSSLHLHVVLRVLDALAYLVIKLVRTYLYIPLGGNRHGRSEPI